jgi:AmmeMemoRadiSam system protein B
MEQHIRRAAVAGSWYPGDAGELAEAVETYLHAAGPQAVSGRLVALVSPHAGLHYSGPVAAYGYSLLRGSRDQLVVLVGPSHHVAFEGLALPGSGSWETPLGRIPTDEPLMAALLAADRLFFQSSRVHRDEHSLEMQLPFLAHLVPQLRIVPIVMGSQSRTEVAALAQALARVLRERPALLVASSDLSHFHPSERAQALDAIVAGLVERYDDEGLMALLEESHEHACGGGPIVAIMKAARALGATKARVLRYANSGDVAMRDKSRVVGYLSAAMLAPED